MTKPWRFREEADEEVAEAYLWYHAERPGLGDELQAALESAMASLVEMPKMASGLHDAARPRRPALPAQALSVRDCLR